MYLAPIAQLLALAAMASPTDPGSSAISETTTAETAVAKASVPLIATRQSVFAIPFRIERPDSIAREPIEVRLFVSGDRGKTWQLYDQAEPAQQHFMFRAAADGEYWFLVRTLDRSGRLWPEGTGGLGLRVVVDTEQPTLELQAHRGPAGQITARWLVAEPHLRPDNLTISYRTADDAQWQPVAIDRQNTRTANSIQTGEVTWWPQAAGKTVQVRTEVTDAAGNLAVSHARVEPGPAPGPQVSSVAQSRSREADMQPSPTEDPSAGWRAGAATPMATPWPANHAPADIPLGSPTASNSPGNAYPPGDDYRQRDPTHSAQRDPFAGSPDVSMIASPSPPIQNQYVPPTAQSDGMADGTKPPGPRPRMVNSRLFELEYDVESVGSSGIASVELWGTRDGGRTWKSYTLDNDNRSPLLVTVDDEALYGFRVVVTSGAGLGGQPPRSGEPPEIHIGVDLTKPTAEITATQLGTGTDSDKLAIFWEATDTMLAAQPISLSYSERPGGTWTAIATDLENTGRYTWRLGDRVPEAVHLRLEVWDAAGNLGVFETKEAVPLARFRPSVHIRDVRPLGQSGRRSPTRYQFR